MANPETKKLFRSGTCALSPINRIGNDAVVSQSLRSLSAEKTTSVGTLSRSHAPRRSPPVRSLRPGVPRSFRRGNRRSMVHLDDVLRSVKSVGDRLCVRLGAEKPTLGDGLRSTRNPRRVPCGSAEWSSCTQPATVAVGPASAAQAARTGGGEEGVCERLHAQIHDGVP